MDKELKTKLEILNEWVDQLINDCYDLQNDLTDTQDYLDSILQEDDE